MSDSQSPTSSNAWYRQPAMLVVAGVMFATFLSGAGMLTAALHVDDPLIMSDQEYRQWKDENRVTEARDNGD